MASLTKKYLMALTGLLLLGFVIAHMLGNLQIFLGQDALNDYAKHLKELPYLLWPARVLLLTALIVHVAVAVSLSRENRSARPNAYAYQNTVRASYASRTMFMSGIIIFLFVVYHLLHFTFGVTNPELFHMADPKGREDVYSMVVLSFRHTGISIVYVLAMGALCFHLSHGIQSAFQSVGLNHPRYTPWVKFAGSAISLVILVGNISIPLAAHMHWLRLPGGP